MKRLLITVAIVLLSTSVYADDEVNDFSTIGTMVSGDKIVVIDSDAATGSKGKAIVVDGNAANAITGAGTMVAFEPAKGTDDNYVTDVEKAALHTEVTRDSLGVDTDDSPTFAGVLADTITEKTADAGVTIENVELKDGQISTVAVASPNFILNDSGSPGADKDSGGLSSQYVDGVDGSENSSVEFEAMANGSRVSGISVDGQSDGTVEIVMNGPVTFPAGDISSAAIGNDQIDSQHYASASIDNEHLADDAVDSDEIADGAVDFAHLAADAKLQSLQVSDLNDTSTPSVLTAEETTNKVLSNYKSTGADHVFTLPTAHAAGNVIFQIGDEFQVDVEPPSGTSIYLEGTAAASDEHIVNDSDTLLERMVCYCPYVNGAYVWACYSDSFDEATP